MGSSARVLSSVLVVALLGACSPAKTGPARAVVVLQDGSVPDARSVVTPAVLGLRAALEGSGIGVVVVDDGGRPDAAVAAARAAAADPAVIAVVVAPFTEVPLAGLASLADRGVSVLSLSDLGSPPPRRGTWRRLVPSVGEEAAALAATLTGSRLCVGGEPTPASAALGAAVRDVPGPHIAVLPGDPTRVASDAIAVGCSAVAWTGSAGGASALRATLDRAGGGAIALALGPAARTTAYAQTGWPSGVGTVAVCGCVDVTTSAAPEAEGFVHAYQQGTGLAPGPYAVEGADVGEFLRREAGSGGGREAITAALRATKVLHGIGGPYAWEPSGELVLPDLRTYEVTGVRWELIAPPPSGP